MGLPRHSLCQQRLSRSGRAYQQRPFREPCADLGVFPRIVQEIYHLHQRFLRLVLPCHVLEGDSRLLLHVDLCIALPHTHGPAAAAHLLKDYAQQNPHQQYGQHHEQQNIHDSARIIAEHPASVYSVLLQPCRESIQILHDHS